MQRVLICGLLFSVLVLATAHLTSDWLYEDNQHQLDQNALDLFQSVQKRSYRYYKRRTCRRWNSPCAPWSDNPHHACCYSQGLSCKCNLWMQNCRCVSRLWGK